MVDFLSSWLLEAFHSFQLASRDKEFYMQTVRTDGVVCDNQGTNTLCFLLSIPFQILF